MSSLRFRNTLNRHVKRQLLTCLAAAVGGGVFALLGLPLPWMLGAMSITLVAALLEVRVVAPDKLRPYTVAVIGVMLGSGFSADTFAQLSQWSLSLLFLTLCVALQALAVALFFVRAGKMTPVTALFAAMPGGLVEMMEIGRRHGGDERAIILAHAARIVLVITLVAVWFRVVLGYDLEGIASHGAAQMSAFDIGVLTCCGLLGGLAGLKFNLPAPTFLGPMLLSAAAHMAGWTASSPPAWLVIAAQILLGAIVGCRFVGVPTRQVLRAFGLSLVATLIMLGIALAFSSTLSDILHQAPEQILLGFAPGGLTEMSLISLSMGADVAYIATHHLFRVVLLLSIAGSLLAWIAKILAAWSPVSRK